VIDPTLVYSTYLGGAGDDTGSSIDVDNAGNIYVNGNDKLNRVSHQQCSPFR